MKKTLFNSSKPVLLTTVDAPLSKREQKNNEGDIGAGKAERQALDKSTEGGLDTLTIITHRREQAIFDEQTNLRKNLEWRLEAMRQLMNNMEAELERIAEDYSQLEGNHLNELSKVRDMQRKNEAEREGIIKARDEALEANKKLREILRDKEGALRLRTNITIALRNKIVTQEMLLRGYRRKEQGERASKVSLCGEASSTDEITGCFV
ncbi:hypothetical protein FOZ63_000041 [Perkinsus olseni]|uniref:Uncharacterized protein n=1 Tax=Perkinsus olseni TaxID=32597 RepID=A0A7J6U8W9_PEROL|nr:hypothetical protein FOZ63_000041 [Perkinsus olseni]KAF4753848.1 hypothetical protein FOZ62_032235 [Perkinsus olseni]